VSRKHFVVNSDGAFNHPLRRPLALDMRTRPRAQIHPEMRVHQ
jgi:hypothetical protein